MSDPQEGLLVIMDWEFMIKVNRDHDFWIAQIVRQLEQEKAIKRIDVAFVEIVRQFEIIRKEASRL